jgi:uncharacterized protein involved in type VI secretion and phage assembly
MRPFYYTAVVTDTQDPDGMGRVRVSRNGDEESVTNWIPVLTPCAANGAGFFMLPETGSQVIVLVLDGAENKGVVIGGLWHSNAKPPETAENPDADFNKDGKNSLRFIKSRAGSMFIFDDTEGAEKIQIIAPGGKSRLEFLVPEEKIRLETDTDVTIDAQGSVTISAEEIQIESKKGISVNGENIQVSAKGEMNLSTQKDLTLKGSSIALN